MKGWILYKRNKNELTGQDHGVNRLLAAAAGRHIELEVWNPRQFQFVASDTGLEISCSGHMQSLPDFILPRLGADASLFELALIRQFELSGVSVINNAAAIATARDKFKVCQLLKYSHLPCPDSMYVNMPVDSALIEREIGFPLVIKTLAGAKGLGVHLCQSADDLENLLGLFDPLRSPELIVQSFIQSSYGRDLRVLVVGGEVIGCMQRTAKQGFKANFSLGAEVSVYSLSDDIKSYAIRTAELTGLEIAGIDLLFGKDGYLICEANSSPGFKGMEQAIDIDVADKILSYIVKKIKQ